MNFFNKLFSRQTSKGEVEELDEIKDYCSIYEPVFEETIYKYTF